MQGFAGEAGEVDRDVLAFEGGLDVRAQSDRPVSVWARTNAPLPCRVTMSRSSRRIRRATLTVSRATS